MTPRFPASTARFPCQPIENVRDWGELPARKDRDSSFQLPELTASPLIRSWGIRGRHRRLVCRPDRPLALCCRSPTCEQCSERHRNAEPRASASLD